MWERAHELALSRRSRTTANRRLEGILVWRIKQIIIEKQWSPEQIKGNLMKEGISVSIQTIYNIIDSDESGELLRHRRHPDFKRRPQARKRHTKATNFANRTSIHERPAAADGSRFGDWEMDLIVDGGGNAILVLVERLTNFVMMERLKHGRKAEPLAQTVIRLLFPYRKTLKSITTDNGSEFADHLTITRKLWVTVYFADSYYS